MEHTYINIRILIFSFFWNAYVVGPTQCVFCTDDNDQEKKKKKTPYYNGATPIIVNYITNDKTQFV